MGLSMRASSPLLPLDRMRMVGPFFLSSLSLGRLYWSSFISFFLQQVSFLLANILFSVLISLPPVLRFDFPPFPLRFFWRLFMVLIFENL